MYVCWGFVSDAVGPLTGFKAAGGKGKEEEKRNRGGRGKWACALIVGEWCHVCRGIDSPDVIVVVVVVVVAAANSGCCSGGNVV